MAIEWKKVAFAADIVSDEAYAASWDGVTDVAPSKNAVYDQMELLAPKANPVFSSNVPDIAALGNNIVNNGDFSTNDLTGWTAAAGWSAASGAAVHNGGIADTTPLVQAVSLVDTFVYMVEVTTTGISDGSVTLTFGSLDGSYIISSNTTTKQSFTADATASFNLTLTPTGTFNGAVDNVTVRLISPNNTPLVNVLDNDASSVAAIRGSAALYNFGIGAAPLRYNVYGVRNVALGYNSLWNNTTGYGNTAIGYNALVKNTTGYQNVAIGYNSLSFNKVGYNNIAIGLSALASNSTGFANLALGTNAMANITTGCHNVGIGVNAGRFYGTGTAANATSNWSTYIGGMTRASADGDLNETVIGYSAVGNGSNTVTLGNTSVTGIYMGATKLIGARGAAVANATGIGDVVAQLNALLARIRAHGLIAT